MHNQDVGFDMEQVLVIKSPRVRPASVEDSFNHFKETLLTLPGVHKVSHVTEVPGRQILWDAGAIKRAGEDDSKSKNYQNKSEELFGRVFQLFSALSVLITALGLFGLASFHVVQRTREIGIRKVLGASVSGIVVLLSKEYIKWILLSTVIAWPVGWYAMQKWLQNFAFHTNPGAMAFAVSLALTLVVAMLTVAFQVIRAATANPVESLRYE